MATVLHQVTPTERLALLGAIGAYAAIGGSLMYLSRVDAGVRTKILEQVRHAALAGAEVALRVAGGRTLFSRLEPNDEASEHGSSNVSIQSDDLQIGASGLSDEGVSALAILVREHRSGDRAKAPYVEIRALVDRLNLEIKALGLRANLNLAIGVAIGLFGAGFLAWVAFSAEQFRGGLQERLVALGTKASLVVLIEALAFFFLRMYRRALDDLKFFHNEITTAQLRFVAIQSAPTGVEMLALLQDVARSDRNARLQAGETTVEIEREKIESATTKAVIANLAKLRQ